VICQVLSSRQQLLDLAARPQGLPPQLRLLLIEKSSSLSQRNTLPAASPPLKKLESCL
jgi:hypothetical protein